MREIPEGFVIPDFGGLKRTTSSTSTETQETAAGGYSGPRKLAIICSKGNLDMAYPGLIMGNAAASEGVETHIFFTFWGLDIINKKTNHNLKFSMLGNTAMHMSQLGNIRPGLEHASMPQFMGQIPGMTGIATKMMKRQMAELEVPDVPEFIDIMHAAGVHMYACRLSFDMNKMLEADLHPAVEGVISANDFIELCEGAQIIFV